VKWEHGLEESFGNVPIEQPLAVLGEHGHIPNGVVHVQAHEPAEQQVIVELFHQQPFAAHRVQRLQNRAFGNLMGPENPAFARWGWRNEMESGTQPARKTDRKPRKAVFE
jgi:hypothetical protein